MTDLKQDAEERLLIEAAQKDPSHFAELYERNFSRVYAFVARRVAERHEREDLTSEVFQRALANLDRFEWRGAPFAAWLFRIAANAIADRQQKRSKEHSLPAGEAIEQGPSDEIETRAILFRLVDHLPPDQRRVIIKRFVEQKSIREIAVEFGKSEGAIKQLQFRALENLRARMSDRHE